MGEPILEQVERRRVNGLIIHVDTGSVDVLEEFPGVLLSLQCSSVDLSGHRLILFVEVVPDLLVQCLVDHRYLCVEHPRRLRLILVPYIEVAALSPDLDTVLRDTNLYVIVDLLQRRRLRIRWVGLEEHVTEQDSASDGHRRGRVVLYQAEGLLLEIGGSVLHNYLWHRVLLLGQAELRVERVD